MLAEALPDGNPLRFDFWAPSQPIIRQYISVAREKKEKNPMQFVTEQPLKRRHQSYRRPKNQTPEPTDYWTPSLSAFPSCPIQLETEFMATEFLINTPKARFKRPLT